MGKKLMELSQLEAYDGAKNNLEKIYSTEEGKKFVHHLIYAFNSGQNYYVTVSRRDLIDCVTGSKLDSVFNDDRKLNDNFIIAKLDELKAETSDENKEKIAKEINDRVTKLVEEIQNKSRLAVKSKLSNKIIGVSELQALKDFISDQVKAGNVTIRKMLYYSMHKNDAPKEKTPRRKGDSRKSLASNDEIKSKLESLKSTLK